MEALCLAPGTSPPSLCPHCAPGPAGPETVDIRSCGGAYERRQMCTFMSRPSIKKRRQRFRARRGQGSSHPHPETGRSGKNLFARSHFAPICSPACAPGLTGPETADIRSRAGAYERRQMCTFMSQPSMRNDAGDVEWDTNEVRVSCTGERANWRGQMMRAKR